MFKSLFLPLIAVAAFITLVGLLSQGKLDGALKKVSPIVATTDSQKVIKIDTTEIKVDVARTDAERSKGLGGVTKLDEKSGMIFVFPKNSKPTFWMKDTKISLDIIWIDENKIVGINSKVPTEIGKKDNELKRYIAPTSVDYVLEVNGGFSDTYNIKVGQMIYGLEQL